MNRLDFYYRQKVTEAELDQAFAHAEDADRALMTDTARTGVQSGMTVTEQGTPNMTVQVAAGIAYTPNGERMSVATTQNVNCAQDYNAVTTAVAGVGNEKWISIFIGFDRTLTDPRVDGNSLTVYFSRAEAYAFRVVQGSEATAGTATRPSLDSSRTLLADVLLVYGSTTVTNSMISTTRRQDSIVVSGTPRALARGKVNDALSDILGWYNAHVNGTADEHLAVDVGYAGTATTWFAGEAIGAMSVEAMLDQIVTKVTDHLNGFLRIKTAGLISPTAGSNTTNTYADVASFSATTAALNVGDVIVFFGDVVTETNGAVTGLMRVMCSENGGGYTAVTGSESVWTTAAAQVQTLGLLGMRIIGTAGAATLKVQIRNDGTGNSVGTLASAGGDIFYLVLRFSNV